MRWITSAALAAALSVGSFARAELTGPNITLLEAVATQDLDAAKKAIADGADPSLMDADISPLSTAAGMNNGPMVDLLLAAGADPSVKDSKGKTAADQADAVHATAIAAKLRAAGHGSKPAAAAEPAAPAPVAAVPAPAAKPEVAPAPAAADSGETGTFDDVEFKTPDPKKWTPKTVDNNLVFSAPLPPPDFCTITVYASRDLKGGEDEFKKAFDDLVAQSLKKLDTVKVEKDSGAKPVDAKKPGLSLMQRVIMAEAKDFHTVHFFVAIHSQDRMQLIAYQSSGTETFQGNQADASAFLNSVNVVTKKTLNP